MQFHEFPLADLTSRVQETLGPLEKWVDRAYWDIANPPQVTIGYGVNLSGSKTYLRLVLERVYGAGVLNIDGFVDAFSDAIRTIQPTTEQVIANSRDWNDILRTGLDGLIGQYLLPGQTFQPLQVNEPLAAEIERNILEGFTLLNGEVERGVYSQLDGLLEHHQVIVPRNTNEYVALVSLYYNGKPKEYDALGQVIKHNLVGSKLLTALKTENRAEAWYEIRYNSNANGIHANRRYTESDLFGLFENTQTTEPEAKAIYRMYTAHRETILRYEQDFPPSAAISNRAATNPGPSRTFYDESFVARNLLFTNYATFTGAPAINGEVLVGSDLQRDTFDLQPVSIPGVPAHVFDLSKNDLMFGEGGDDFLRGRGGVDVLYGGAGDDRLVKRRAA